MFTRNITFFMDFLAELGSIAIATRMRRVSDEFVRQVREVYLQSGIDFDPKYFAVVRYIHERGSATVMEMANAFGLTHPAVSQMVKSLIDEEIIDWQCCVEDDRKRNLKFSTKGKKLVQKLAPLWRELTYSIDEVLNETQTPFLESLTSIESSLSAKSLAERIGKGLRRDSSANAVEIIEWNPRYAAAFEDLNRSWIEKYFKFEKNDLRILQDPEKYIIDPGGAILFAKLNGTIVGTCALFNHGKGVYELARMAVAEHVRRSGIGRALTAAAIKKARQLGAKKLMLETFRPTLNAGIELYRSCGFIEMPPPSGKYSYAHRANVYMEYPIRG